MYTQITITDIKGSKLELCISYLTKLSLNHALHLIKNRNNTKKFKKKSNKHNSKCNILIEILKQHKNIITFIKILKRVLNWQMRPPF